MERGGLSLRAVAASLAVLALLALPSALADTEAPVQGQAHAGYEADAGAILAQARSWDPTFHLDFLFQHADVYEVFIPDPGLANTRAAGLPTGATVLSRHHVDAGSLSLDPGTDGLLFLFSDPRGLSAASLPLALPRDPAHFAVDTLAPLRDAVGQPGLDPHNLQLGSGLHYTVEGLAVEQPLDVRATGDILALVAGVPARVQEGRNVYVSELQPMAHGEKFLLVQAQGARVDLVAEGLTAILRSPTAGVGAGAQLIAGLEGRQFGAKQDAAVASSPQGLTLDQRNGLASQLLRSTANDAATGNSAAPQGAGFVVRDARIAAASAVLGTAVALAAVGLAAAAGAGKYGLFALLAPLYARLHSDEVLANQTRERMYRYVVEHPGVNVSEVVKQFGLGWGATVYHLRVLERSHLVSANKQGRQVCYFQNGGRYNGQMAGISALRNANASWVARTILAQPGVQQREICRLTGLAQPTVSWHLQRLEEAQLVASDGAARKRYVATPTLSALAERGFVEGYGPAVVAQPAATATTVGA